MNIDTSRNHKKWFHVDGIKLTMNDRYSIMRGERLNDMVINVVQKLLKKVIFGNTSQCQDCKVHDFWRLYAIAYATSICYDQDPAVMNFDDQSLLRHSVVIDSKIIVPFPSLSK